MGRGNPLTDHEKEMIDAFEKDGHSQREIAKNINRSRCAVNNYIKNKNKTPKTLMSPGSWTCETDFPDFLKSLIIVCLFLGLSFSSLPGIFWGVFLFFM